MRVRKRYSTKAVAVAVVLAVVVLFAVLSPMGGM